jgi:hypothetical protein
MNTENLEHTLEALRSAREELGLLRHSSIKSNIDAQLAVAESSLANMRDRNAVDWKRDLAGHDLADAVTRLVNEVIDSRLSGDSFEDRVRPMVEEIATDLIENASIDIGYR